MVALGSHKNSGSLKTRQQPREPIFVEGAIQTTTVDAGWDQEQQKRILQRRRKLQLSRETLISGERAQNDEGNG